MIVCVVDQQSQPIVVFIVIERMGQTCFFVETDPWMFKRFMRTQPLSKRKESVWRRRRRHSTVFTWVCEQLVYESDQYISSMFSRIARKESQVHSGWYCFVYPSSLYHRMVCGQSPARRSTHRYSTDQWHMSMAHNWQLQVLTRETREFSVLEVSMSLTKKIGCARDFQKTLIG